MLLVVATESGNDSYSRGGTVGDQCIEGLLKLVVLEDCGLQIVLERSGALAHRPRS